MGVMVHLANANDVASIKCNGIKIGKYRKGVYCMPVLPSFYLSHQWLRELKRNGARTLVGVYFKVSNKTLVYAGRYGKPHKHIPLGQAIREIQVLEDPQGYEIIIDRSINTKEITGIKQLPQNVGWRYQPGAHQKRPCGCDFCIGGSIKGDRIRKKYNPVEPKKTFATLLNMMRNTADVADIEILLAALRGKRRRADPQQLLFLLDRNESTINKALAETLIVFKHKNTRHILADLMKSADSETRAIATESWLQLYGDAGQAD